MHEAVGDGARRRRVVKELAPILEGQIGGDDGRHALVPLVEDLIEEIGAARVEAQVTELVDEQQLIPGPRGQPLSDRVSRLGGDEVVDEIGGEREAHAVTAQAGELAQGVAEVRLADAAWAEKDDVAALPDELEGGRS